MLKLTKAFTVLITTSRRCSRFCTICLYFFLSEGVRMVLATYGAGEGTLCRLWQTRSLLSAWNCISSVLW